MKKEGQGKDQRTLALPEVSDVFEAESLHSQLLDMLREDRLSPILLDLSGTARVDLTTIQIIQSLKRSVPVELRATPEIVESLRFWGIAL